MENKSGQIKFFWCALCQGVAIICPHCGNNSCNGAYGKLIPDDFPAGEGDEPCPVCPKVYKLHKDLDESGAMKLIEDTIPNKTKIPEDYWVSSSAQFHKTL